MKKIMKVCLSIAFGFYLFILSWLILFKYLSIPDIISRFTFSYEGFVWNTHNFIPFKTIGYYLFFANDINFDIRVENLTGNILGFVPFGMLFPLLFSKFHSFKKIALATFCLSLTFELLQLIFKFGSFDVDDLILNTVGGVVGYIPVMLVIKYKEKRQEYLSV
ncbi:VanZ family protein [Robertmurraya massiliosenegalensis]|uniref:VanZ family protein n=1 Tax=Robertmurraya massiliosenegalensis TaxID=1287657 RepID=UPI00031125C5|nr:VanZ family protein [Robertmurraya massiliosenegalensis]